MEFMYSEKSKKLIVLEGYKFGFQKKLADDIERWIYCAKRTCKSNFKINNLNIIISQQVQQWFLFCTSKHFSIHGCIKRSPNWILHKITEYSKSTKS